MRWFNIFAVVLAISLVQSSVHATPAFLSKLGSGIKNGVRNIGDAVETVGETVVNVVEDTGKAAKNTVKSLGSNAKDVVTSIGTGNLVQSVRNGVSDVFETLGNGLQSISNDLGSGLNKLLNKDVQEQTKNEVEKQIEKSGLSISKEDQGKIFNAIIDVLTTLGDMDSNTIADPDNLSNTIYNVLNKKVPLETIQEYVQLLASALRNISIDDVSESPKQSEYEYYYIFE